MLLSTENIGVGDTRRVVVSYAGFLAKGETLSGKTITVAATSPPAASMIGAGGLAPAISVDAMSVIFYVVAAAAAEKFTADIQVTTSLSQIVNDTMQFSVVAA